MLVRHPLLVTGLLVAGSLVTGSVVPWCLPAKAAPPVSVAGLRFEDVTDDAGLATPLLGIMGHGAAAGDYDGDGDVDLVVGGFADRPNEEYEPAEGPVANVLLRNDGQGRFVRDPQPAVETFARTSGAVFADLDGDGDLDLYVANNSKGRTRRDVEPQRSAQLKRSQLFRNDDGQLVDVTEASGAAPERLLTARNVGVFDYDLDGRLDLFVVEDRFTREPSSVLLRNLGDMRFEDVTEQVGLPSDLYGLGLAVADLNGDRRADFFVGHSNRLFLSDGKGRYVESPDNTGVFAWQPLDGEDWPCGAAFGDLNGDGRLDLVLAIHGERARNRIFLNRRDEDGVPRFEDETKPSGLPAQLSTKSPHVEIRDLDNDGRLDLYFSSAWLDEAGTITPYVCRNLGPDDDGVPRFEVPEAPADARMVYFPAGPAADYDGDGRIDLFLVNWFRGNRCRLLRNTSPKRHWLDVRVDGPGNGIGSRVTVTSVGTTARRPESLGVREITTGYGYASGQPAVPHFGLGDHDSVNVRLELPDGRVMERTEVQVDRVITFETR